MLRLAGLLLWLAAAVWPQARLDTGRVDGVAGAQLKQWNIPGMAVAVVTREGAYTRGYGVRSVDSRQPVTAHTLFATGSLTKSFTALAAALLVDEGKLDWDTPVREYLPWFRMYDPAATELMTMRDLLTHRSGLPRYDFLRFAVPLEREELVRRLRYLPPTSSFRARYQYQNLMYTAAGYLEGVLGGSSWEELIEKRVLAPLGMRESTVRVADTRRREDYALPHVREGEALKPVEFYDYQRFGVGPNGAVNSSAEDMARYLKFHLGDGAFDGKRLLSRRQFEELHQPQMVTGEDSTYALGWGVSWTTGFKLVSHSGSIRGFSSFAAFAPERGEGFVVLTNSPEAAPRVAGAIAGQVLGWKSTRQARRAEPPPAAAAPPPAIDGPLSRPPSAYAGRYAHPGFGRCEVVESGGQLTLSFPARSLRLRHLRFDVFAGTAEDDPRAAAVEVQFFLDVRGAVSAVEMRLEPAAPPLRFARQ